MKKLILLTSIALLLFTGFVAAEQGKILRAYRDVNTITAEVKTEGRLKPLFGGNHVNFFPTDLDVQFRDIVEFTLNDDGKATITEIVKASAPNRHQGISSYKRNNRRAPASTYEKTPSTHTSVTRPLALVKSNGIERHPVTGKIIREKSTRRGSRAYSKYRWQNGKLPSDAEVTVKESSRYSFQKEFNKPKVSKQTTAMNARIERRARWLAS
jgi:hypothetical protein